MTKPKERLKPLSLAAYPAEIERWKAAAKADSRPLAQWLRLRVLDGETLKDLAKEGLVSKDSLS